MTKDTPADSSSKQHVRKLSSTIPPSSYLGPVHTRVRLASHGPSERARPTLSRTLTGAVDGYASDGDSDRRSKSFFTFRPRSKTENRSVDGHEHLHANRGAEKFESALQCDMSDIRNSSYSRTTRSPLSRHRDNYEHKEIRFPAAEHGNTELAVPAPALPWQLPTLLAHQHNLFMSSASMERLISPSDLKTFQFNAPESTPLPPKFGGSGNDNGEIGSHRPFISSGALDNGAHFSRETSVVENPSSRYELATETSLNQPKSRNSQKKPKSQRVKELSLQSWANKTILGGPTRKSLSRDAAFIFKNGKKHHRYSAKEVPFPRSYDRLVLDHEVWETLFYEQLVGGVSYHHFETPPERVLDIGCGPGAWILNSARVWKNTYFYGLDIAPIQPDLTRLDSDLANRITWVHANLLERLPFPDNYFDFIIVKRLSRSIPEDQFSNLADEIFRVMKPGSIFEAIEEDLYFPGTCKVEVEDNVKSSGVSYRSAKSSTSTPSISSSSNRPHVAEHSRRSSSVALKDLPNVHTISSESSQMNQSGSFGGEPELMQREVTHSPPVSRGLSVRTNYSSESPSSSLNMLLPRQKSQKRSISHSSSIDPTSPEGSAPAWIINESRFDSGVVGGASPSSMKPSASFSDSKVSIRSLLGSSDPYTAVTRSESRTTSSPIDKSSMPFPISTKPGTFEKYTFTRKEGEEEAKKMRSIDLNHPYLRQPLNPRDHSLLERIYTEMHEDRFINLRPLSLMAMCMEMHFTRTSSTTPISFAFPPRPQNKSTEVVFGEEGNPIVSTIENNNMDHAIIQYAHHIVTSGRKGNPGHPNTADAQKPMTRADELALQYVIIDSARLPAAPTRRPKHRLTVSTQFNPKGVSGGKSKSPAHSLRSPISMPNIVEPNNGKLAHTPPEIPSGSASPCAGSPLCVEPPTPLRRKRSPLATQGSPPKPLEVDLKSLHMHLSLRVVETLACAEAMWEWVLSEQERYAESQKMQRVRSESHASAYDERNEEDDLQMMAIRMMSREDFDYCLSRFEMDMQDKVALDHALDQYLHIKPELAPSRSAERVNFDTTCAAWEALQAADPGLSDGQSSISTSGDAKYLSRTMRIFNGYKPLS